jgi:putative ABC transport system permease protein
MAARNIARSPQRAAATALALTIGLTVVSAVAVTAASTKASLTDIVNEGNRSDLILKAAGQGAGIPPAAADVLRRRRDIAAVVEMRYSGARVDGHATYVAGLQTHGLSDVADLGIRDGDLGDFGKGTVLLGTKQADALGLQPGDDVNVTFPETGKVTLKVAATFEHDSIIGSAYVVSLPEFEANVTSALDEAILVRDADGTSAPAVEKSVKRALHAYPNVTVSNPPRSSPRTRRPTSTRCSAWSPRCCCWRSSWPSSASSTRWCSPWWSGPGSWA